MLQIYFHSFILLFSIFQHKDLKFYVIKTVMLKKPFPNFIPKNIYLLTSERPHFFNFKLKQFKIYFLCT